MSTAGDLIRQLPSEVWERLEPILVSFEAAWRRGDQPALKDYWKKGTHPFALLAELVHLDLEFRLKAGQPIRVEAFLKDFPELSRAPQAVLDLIAAEFDLRQRQEPGLTVETYLKRFPQFQRELPDRLRAGPAGERSLSRASMSKGVPPTASQGVVSWQGKTLESAGAPDRADARWPAIPGYDVLGELGRGGMGVVYKARQRNLDRMVAVKMILAGAHAGSHELARFRGEAEKLAQLQHPNIVQIFEVGHQQGQPYLALEFIDGGSLAQKIAGMPQPVRAAAQMTEALARATHVAHQAGIIHRDLKPANVLLTRDGTPKITDFGLAKRLESTGDQTQTGVILGTLGYMAPEQAAGHNAAIGPAADVHALGGILYELLTGRPPFRAETPLATLHQVLEQDAPPPSRLVPRLPRDLETICLKCLHKDPGCRYATALDLAEELRRFLADEPIQARPVSRAERLGRWCRRNPALATAGGLATVAMVTLTVVSLLWAIAQARTSADLRQQQQQTESALTQSQFHEREAVGYRKQAERQTVSLIVDRGLAACEEGNVAHGLLWLAHGLETAERSDASTDLQRVLRANLAAWSQELRPLRQTFSHDAGYMSKVLGKAGPSQAAPVSPRPFEIGHQALVFSPNSRHLVTCSNQVAQVWDVATGQAIGPLLKHDGTINAAAFSPDGRTLLTGAKDGTARLWDVATGNQRHAPLAHGRDVGFVAFAPDGRTLLTVSGAEVRVWDAATGGARAVLRGHQSLVTGAAYSPDSRIILTGSTDGTGRLWETDTGKLREVLEPGIGAIHVVAFGPDGQTVVTAFDGAQLWTAATGQALGNPLSHPAPIWVVAYRPDGHALLSADVQGNARLWDTAKAIPINIALPKQGGYYGAAFSPDGKTLLLAGAGGTAWVGSAATGQPVGPPIVHDNPVGHSTFSPDGRLILTNDSRGVVRLWDAVAHQPHAMPVTIPPGSRNLANGPRGETVLVTQADNAVQLWDIGLKKPIGPLLQHSGPVLAAAYRPNGTTLLTGSADKTARLWDTATGQPLLPPLLHPAAVQGVAWAPDGRSVLTRTAAGENRLWDTETGRPLTAAFRFSGTIPFAPDGHIQMATGKRDLVTMNLSSLAVRDGQAVVARSQGNRAVVSDAVTGQPLGPPIHAVTKIDALAFSPDGRTLVTGCIDVRLWDVTTGQQLGAPLLPQASVYAAAFNADGRRLVTWGLDDTVQLWDPATGAAVGPTHRNVAVGSFSPDGQFLLLGMKDRSFRVWDAATGKPIGPAIAHHGADQGLSLSQDGKHLWAKDANGKPWLWDVAPLPLNGRAEQTSLWAQVITGLRLDSGGVAHGLDFPTWRARHQQLMQVGIPTRP